MKRGLVTTLITIVALSGIVSAQFESYTNFALGDLLNSIDSSTMVLGALMLIIFALLNFSLSRVFKDQYGNPNKAISGTISLAVSLLVIYWINARGYRIEDFFYDIGFSGGLLSVIFPILVLAGLVYVVWRFRFKGFFLITGITLVLIALFTDWVYEKGIVLIIGIVLLLIWAFLFHGFRSGAATSAEWTGKKIKEGYGWSEEKYTKIRERQRQRANTRRGLQDRLQDVENELRRVHTALNDTNARLRQAAPGTREAASLQSEVLQLQRTERQLQGERTRVQRDLRRA